MPLVHDFVPVEERFEQAGLVLTSGGGSWLAEFAAAALNDSAPVAVEFGAVRSVDHAVIVPLRWGIDGGPFTTLDADLRLEPVPPDQSHLTLSGTYAVSSPDTGPRIAMSRHRLTESCVRRFLVGVAAMLERGSTDAHETSLPPASSADARDR